MKAILPGPRGNPELSRLFPVVPRGGAIGMIESKFMDFLIGLFGRGRARLGVWPHREIVETVVAAMRKRSGESYIAKAELRQAS